MVVTLLFAGITSLMLCFFASLAEDFLQPKKRKAFIAAASKSREEKDKT